MGRPKKENIVKTEEEIKRDERLKELEKEVIRQIVVARKSQHLSQRVVGERAGIIRETVAKIENNLNSPQINTLIRLLEPIGYTLGVVPLEQKEEAEETAVVNN
ncbi:MAG: helix-turn-helix domain-containing protein [Tenericutes bacterium]|nr:helix-turn-helix domain-containing protein [Mycoplasmatota bacterium]